MGHLIMFIGKERRIPEMPENQKCFPTKGKLVFFLEKVSMSAVAERAKKCFEY